MGRPPSPDQDKFIIRLPDGMRDQIKAAAEASGRSMTAEIVARLRLTFDSEAWADSTSKAAAARLTSIGMQDVAQADVEKHGAAKLTLVDVSEDLIDYITGKVLARLQSDD